MLHCSRDWLEAVSEGGRSACIIITISSRLSSASALSFVLRYCLLKGAAKQCSEHVCAAQVMQLLPRFMRTSQAAAAQTHAADNGSEDGDDTETAKGMARLFAEVGEAYCGLIATGTNPPTSMPSMHPCLARVPLSSKHTVVVISLGRMEDFVSLLQFLCSIKCCCALQFSGGSARSLILQICL